MAKVYSGPVRFLFKGNPDLSKKYAALGRKFLDMAIERSGGQKVNWTRVLPNKTVIHVYSWGIKGYNILIDTSFESIEEGLPVISGVFIEPTSDDAPSGWGPPKTEEFPVGTPGETPIGVVINNNPDDPYIKRTIAYGGDDYEGSTPDYILDWPIPNDLGYLTWRAEQIPSAVAYHFHRYLCVPIGTEIFAYNKLLCEIPEETLAGCGLQVFDDVKYLYAIIYKNDIDIKIIRRVYTSEYTNNNPISSDNPLGWEDISDWITLGSAQGYNNTELLFSSGAYFSSDGTKAVITLATTVNSFYRAPIGIVELDISGTSYNLSYDIITKSENDLETGGLDESGLSTQYAFFRSNFEDQVYTCNWGDGFNKWTATISSGTATAVFNGTYPGSAANDVTSQILQSKSYFITTRETILGADYKANELVTITKDICEYKDYNDDHAYATGLYTKEVVHYCEICYPTASRSGQSFDIIESGSGNWKRYSQWGTSANITFTYPDNTVSLTSTLLYDQYGYFANSGFFGSTQDRGDVTRIIDSNTGSIYHDYCNVYDPTTYNNNSYSGTTIDTRSWTVNEKYIVYLDLRYDNTLITAEYYSFVDDSGVIYAPSILKVLFNGVTLFTGETYTESLWIDNGHLYQGVSYPSIYDSPSYHKSTYGLHTYNSILSNFYYLRAVTDKYGYTYIEYPEWTIVDNGAPYYDFDYLDVDLTTLTQYTNYSTMGFEVFTKLGYYGDSPKFNTLLLV